MQLLHAMPRLVVGLRPVEYPLRVLVLVLRQVHPPKCQMVVAIGRCWPWEGGNLFVHRRQSLLLPKRRHWGLGRALRAMS